MVVADKQLEQVASAVKGELSNSGGSSRLEELFEAFLRIEYALPESISVSYSGSNCYSTSYVKIGGQSFSGCIPMEYGAEIQTSKLPKECTVKMNQYKLWQNNGTQQAKTHLYAPDWDISTYDPTLVGVPQIIKEKESARTVYRWPQIYNPDHMGAEIKFIVKEPTVQA
jgi:hypothetical protein